MDDLSPPASRGGASDRTGLLLGGRYRLIRPIATGGMAQVWEADDEVLVRPVAVKLLHDHLATDDAFIERFRHEAIAAARLSHPSIVSIFDTISEAGNEAIVMELVHGTTLRRRLDVVGVMDVREVVAIGSQVADALDTAHRAQVVHRDIKPANILLSTDARVLVADFGIAKAFQGADLTAEGAMVGTAKYLAPEQVEAGKVDGRTDLYSLGVVLYEALCGRVPFQADTDTATALARLHQPPLRLRQVRAEIPHDIEDVVLRAMARHPDDRFGDAAQMRAALLDCVDGPRPTLRPVTTDDTTLITDATTVGAAPGRIVDPTPVPRATRDAPDDLDDVDDLGSPTFSQSERGWLVPALLIVLVAVALGVAGMLFGQSDTRDRLFGDDAATTTTRPPATPLKIADASSFDPPPGDGAEDDDGAPNVLDGDTDTEWRTEIYEDGAEMRLKPGVGLVVELDEPATLGTLEIESPSAGWNASIYVRDDPSAPATLEDWGTPVTGRTDIDAGTTRFDLKDTEGSSVMIWITRLTEEGRVRIAEVDLLP